MNTASEGIWPPYEAFYISSMQFNCQSAVRSLVWVMSAFEQLPSPTTLDDIAAISSQKILNELQNLVVQGAALSRYFWPVRKGHERRADHLKRAFSVTESSPLYDRNLRNAIEHFDERLDNYLSSGIVGCIFPEFVGPRPAEDGIPGHYFRAYFIDDGVFRLLDEEYPVEPLANEILRLNEQLEFMSSQGERLVATGSHDA
jgi:hypothetical protein